MIQGSTPWSQFQQQRVQRVVSISKPGVATSFVVVDKTRTLIFRREVQSRSFLLGRTNSEAVGRKAEPQPCLSKLHVFWCSPLVEVEDTRSHRKRYESGTVAV